MKSNSFQFISSDNNQEHILVLKQRKFPWWILLFLLIPLVLLIPTTRKINIQTIEKETTTPLPDINVTLVYNKHKTFGGANEQSLQQTTDQEGKTIFKLQQPLWARLFISNDTITLSFINGCYHSDNITDNISQFPVSSFKQIELGNDSFFAPIKVVDIKNNNPLDKANVQFVSLNGTVLLNEKTNNGTTQNIELPKCEDFIIIASKEGYQTDTLKTNAATLVQNTNLQTRKLRFLGKTGDFQINLQWNTKDDLDLSCVCPQCSKDTIDAHHNKHNCKLGKGFAELDVDANSTIIINRTTVDSSNKTTYPVENIYWLNPPQGKHKIFVTWYKFNMPKGNKSVDFTLTITDVKSQEKKIYNSTINQNDNYIEFIYPDNE